MIEQTTTIESEKKITGLSEKKGISLTEQRDQLLSATRLSSRELGQACDAALISAFNSAFPKDFQAELGLALVGCGSYARYQQAANLSDTDLQIFWTKQDPSQCSAETQQKYSAALAKFCELANPELTALRLENISGVQTRVPADLEHEFYKYLSTTSSGRVIFSDKFKIFLETLCNTVFARTLCGAEFHSAQDPLKKLLNEKPAPDSPQAALLKYSTPCDWLNELLVGNIYFNMGQQAKPLTSTLSVCPIKIKKQVQRCALISNALIAINELEQNGQIPSEVKNLTKLFDDVLLATNLFRLAFQEILNENPKRPANLQEVLQVSDFPDYRRFFQTQNPPAASRIDPVKWLYESAQACESGINNLLIYLRNREDPNVADLLQPQISPDPFSEIGRVALYLRAKVHSEPDFLPLFKALSGACDRHAYQSFSIYEHSLKSVEILDSLARDNDADQRFASLFNSLSPSNKRCLYFATLLHDCGKPIEQEHTPRDSYLHADIGASLALEAAEQYDFNTQEQKLIAQLIKNHLWLKDVSKRAIHTIHQRVVAALPEEMRNHEFIDLLVLLTYADGRSTNPENWNILRANHLHNAGISAHLHIDGQNPLDDLTDFSRKLFKLYGATRLQGLSLAKAQEVFAKLPTTFRSLPKESICDFINMQQSYAGKPIVQIIPHNLDFDQSDQCFKADLLFLAPDKKYLASNLISILTAQGFNIHSADLLTNQDGVVFNRLTVFHQNDRTQDIERLARKIETSLAKAELQIPTNTKLPVLSSDTEIKMIKHPLDPEGRITIAIKSDDKYSLLERILIACNRITPALSVASLFACTEGTRVENFLDLQAGTREAPYILNEAEKAAVIAQLKAELLQR